MMEEVELCFPQLNTSCWKPKRSFSNTLLIHIILSFISLLTASLNLLLIISISYFKQLHTPTNLLLLSLAVSDFFVGLLMFFQIMLIDGCWFLGDFVCTLYYILDVIITSSSVGNMVLISVDRYVAICDPLRYSTKVTVRGVTVCILFCWGLSVLYSSLIMRDNFTEPGRFKSCTGECVVVINLTEQFLDLILSFIIPITIITVLYIRVFVVAVSQARAMRSNIVANSQQSSVKTTAKKSELKAARTLGVVIVVFLLCLFPYFCFTLVGQDTSINTSSSAFVLCLYYFNSTLNPVIYAFFYPWFRKSVKLIVTLQILKAGSCDANIL